MNRYTEDSGYRGGKSGGHISGMTMVAGRAETTESLLAKEPRIYLFDRDEDVRDSLKMLLESNRMTVEAFGSPTELLKVAADCPGDCVILGINRLVAEGIDLLSMLRRRHVSTPIIFIDGGGDVLTKGAALKAGASVYLERPVGEARLIRSLVDALRRKERLSPPD